MTSDGAGAAAPELWAGVECTVNRVGDAHFDQLELTGHADRDADLERLAWLGVKALRYPVLWERTARTAPGEGGWDWSDSRLARIRALGLRPIVGLVHHGSGPKGTDLLDPAFAHGLAAHAATIAKRYPWIEDWTPVNEPGTTARFSALYGHWYPHHRSTPAFLRALVNECRGTVLAMREIRRINPRARLVQTEDLGRILSTPRLAYQADYENARRLLSLDLLAGFVGPEHPLWQHLLESGIERDELVWFRDHATPADVVGLNYYLTSDRFLDERIERYPGIAAGGNGRDRYVDVEAVRVAEAGIVGHRSLFDEVAARYRAPIAITELHAGCTREEQLRWIEEGWSAARQARADGLDVCAVTLWSAFGASDWDKLVTRIAGSYEPGLFDVRSPTPRPTALAHAARSIARVGKVEHPLAGQPGWWRRRTRAIYSVDEPQRADAQAASQVDVGPPLLIAGANGALGRAFALVASSRGLAHRAIARVAMDIADPSNVEAELEALRPWAVVNAAGYVRVDDAEHERERCFRENVIGPLTLATACRRRGIRFLTFSSDLVFSGSTLRAYAESALPAPLNAYGASKLAAEHAVLGLMPEALVLRTAALFGSWDANNFLAITLQALREGRPVRAARDLVVSPTYVPDLVHAALDLLIDGERGLWHLANEGELSWAQLAQQAARLSNLDVDLVRPCRAADLGWWAPRPRYSALTSERGKLLRPLPAALDAFIGETQGAPAVQAAC